MYQGGPKDGQEIEPEHRDADEIRVSRAYEDGEKETFWYSRDSFGNMVYRGEF